MNDTPKFLYKYREWSKPLHQLVIKETEFFLAEPKSFEDSFDCNIPLDLTSLNEESIQQKYFQLSKKKNPNFSRQQHRQYAREWSKKGLMKDERRIRQIENDIFDKFNSKAGVLSLTEDPLNEYMWDNYADNNKGFCIGLDTDVVINNLNVFGSCGPVQYYKELPLRSLFFDKKEGEPAFFDAFQKLDKWRFEKEYRVFLFKERPLEEQERRIKIPKESIVEVILGVKIPKKDKVEILSFRKDFPVAKFYQMTIKGGKLIKNNI